MKNQKNSPIIDKLTLEKNESGFGYTILFNGCAIARLHQSGSITSSQAQVPLGSPDNAIGLLLGLDAEASKGLYLMLLKKAPDLPS